MISTWTKLGWYLTGQLRVKVAHIGIRHAADFVAKRDEAHLAHLYHHRREDHTKSEYARGVRDALDWATNQEDLCPLK